MSAVKPSFRRRHLAIPVSLLSKNRPPFSFASAAVVLLAWLDLSRRKLVRSRAVRHITARLQASFRSLPILDMLMLVCFFLAAPWASCDTNFHQLEILMPPYEVQKEDTYLCTAVKLNSTRLKLSAVEPRSNQDTVHHMLLFGAPLADSGHLMVSLGCEEPSHDVPVWECVHQPPCKDEDSVLYGWGRNAERVEYPEGVGFSVGEGSGIQTLILQVHYLIKRPKGDTSGIVLKFSEEPAEKAASVLEYAADFAIPPRKKKHPVQNACCYSGFEPITTVAFRVHTHEMGRNVYMTKTSGRTPQGSIIAERDPLLPQVTLYLLMIMRGSMWQGFIPVEKAEKIFPGEVLRVTCDFESSEKTETVRAGFTHQDEMCNMYMMVYSEIPYFGVCLNGHGFYINQQRGILQKNASFVAEHELSNFWRGPDRSKNQAFGQGVGVDRGPDGRIWYLHRGDRPMDMVQRHGQLHVKDRGLVSTDAVLILDPTTGEVALIEGSWGAGFFSVPHMLAVSPVGDVWITDVGKHQVFKFSSTGELLLTLGQEFTPGTDSHHFCGPTEVAVLTDGSVLISDGYCNKRIIRFNAQGEYVNEVVDLELALPHSLAVDECGDRFLVADRDNATVVSYKLSSMIRLGEVYVAGYAMALTRGPYNTFLALVMGTSDKEHKIVALSSGDTLSLKNSWKVPHASFPHDLTLSAAPVELTGTGNRLFTVYLAETDAMKLAKLVHVPHSFKISLPVERIKRDKQPDEGAGKAGHVTVKEKGKALPNLRVQPQRGSPVLGPTTNLSLLLYTAVVISLVVCYVRKPRSFRF